MNPLMKISQIFGLLLIICFSGTVSQKSAEQACQEYTKIVEHPIIFGLSSLANRKNIVGGRLVKRNDDFGHMAALGFGAENNLQWHCGGTLISSNYVLTAAHCTSHPELGPVQAVRLGSTSLKDRKGLTIQISKIIAHPNYKASSNYNDIALLKLRNSIAFSDTIFPACLNSNKSLPAQNDILIATGWGKIDFAGPTTEELMQVELVLYTNRDCKRSYKNVSKKKLANGIVDVTQVCAGGRPNQERDTCQGDSGGPLAMRLNREIYTVIGVTSFGRGCGTSDIPGVYTRVSAFVPWMEKIVWPKS